jgi:hypothetical protein
VRIQGPYEAKNAESQFRKFCMGCFSFGGSLLELLEPLEKFQELFGGQCTRLGYLLLQLLSKMDYLRSESSQRRLSVLADASVLSPEEAEAGNFSDELVSRKAHAQALRAI